MSGETPLVLAWPAEPAEVAPAAAQPGDGVSVEIEADRLAPVLSLTRRRQARATDPSRPVGAAGDLRRRGMADHPARAD